jgi:hypothetical protein
MSFGIQGVGSSNTESNEYPSIFSHSPTNDQPGKIAVILQVAKMQGLSPTELKKRIDAVLSSTQKTRVEVGQKAESSELKSSARPGRHRSGDRRVNAPGVLASKPDATNGSDVSVGGQSLQNLQKALVAMQQHRQFIPSFAQMPEDT